MSTDKDWWIKFFRDSGIPSFESSKYAILFYKNRIQCNMLMDLDKNILKEIGITVIGDRIAILKHAKDVYTESLYGTQNSIESNNSILKEIKNEINEFVLVKNKTSTKKVGVLSKNEKDKEAQFRIVKRKVPSRISQNPIKITTKIIAPKSKTSTKIKSVVIESDDNNSPLPIELKTKKSCFKPLEVGDVSSTTPNFGINYIPSMDSRKLSFVFKPLQTEQTSDFRTNAKFKRTIKEGSDAFYSSGIPTEEFSALTKRIKMEKIKCSSSKSVFERLGTPRDDEKNCFDLVSKSVMRRANSIGRPI